MDWASSLGFYLVFLTALFAMLGIEETVFYLFRRILLVPSL